MYCIYTFGDIGSVPLYRGCPFLGRSFIRGSTVVAILLKTTSMCKECLPLDLSRGTTVYKHVSFSVSII